MYRVEKKNGSIENYDFEKIVKAVSKSAERVMHQFTPEELNRLQRNVEKRLALSDEDVVKVVDLHRIVEISLDKVAPDVAESYRSYRNYKKELSELYEKMYERSKAIEYVGERENANMDSALISTQRSLVYNELNTSFYEKYFLNEVERRAADDGFIYIHDKSARLNTFNCCLFDVANVMNGGFEMGNIWYTEPNSLDVAGDVIGDIILSAAAQQYGKQLAV